MEGFPHIYAVDPTGLPEGLIECQCCHEMITHRRVVAFDEDLAGYVCFRCVPYMAQAEWALRAPLDDGGQVGARLPEMMEALDLDDLERRPLR